MNRNRGVKQSAVRTLAIIFYGLPLTAGCRNEWQRNGRMISVKAAVARGELTDDHQLTPSGYAALGRALDQV